MEILNKIKGKDYWYNPAGDWSDIRVSNLTDMGDKGWNVWLESRNEGWSKISLRLPELECPFGISGESHTIDLSMGEQDECLEEFNNLEEYCRDILLNIKKKGFPNKLASENLQSNIYKTEGSYYPPRLRIKLGTGDSVDKSKEDYFKGNYIKTIVRLTNIWVSKDGSKSKMSINLEKYSIRKINKENEKKRLEEELTDLLFED